ncbi:ribonuclease H-like domain-containing protein [Tanacetum coccineum]
MIGRQKFPNKDGGEEGTENYQVWSCVMLLALEGKNKTRFIDGTCKRSNTNEVLGRRWDRVNAIVLGWILNSISEELFLGQFFSKSAKHVWDELKETYNKVDGFVSFNLHYKINSLSQNGFSIADYYHRINALWKHFDAIVQLPRCTCHAADDFKKHNQLMKLMQFLMGLDDSYIQIRSNILSRDFVPNVRNAYAIISSEESHRVVCSSGNVIDISNLGITVSHFNGTEACITKVRNMILNENLTLYDVLVVPEYCVSLMCVLKVARDNKLIVAFDESKCYVLPHDLRDMKVLEIGNQKDGLYYFNEKQGRHSLGSNGPSTGNEMAATLEDNINISEGVNEIIQNVNA